MALTKLDKPHGFAAFGLVGWLCGLLNGVSGETLKPIIWANLKGQ